MLSTHHLNCCFKAVVSVVFAFVMYDVQYDAAPCAFSMNCISVFAYHKFVTCMLKLLVYISRGSRFRNKVGASIVVRR